jgi:hypothetical protein
MTTAPVSPPPRAPNGGVKEADGLIRVVSIVADKDADAVDGAAVAEFDAAAAAAESTEVNANGADGDRQASAKQAQRHSVPVHLRRVLGLRSLTSLGVGATIGAGIFVMTGIVAHDVSGPAIALSFVVAAIACGFTGMCYVSFHAQAVSRRKLVRKANLTNAHAVVFVWLVGCPLFAG